MKRGLCLFCCLLLAIQLSGTVCRGENTQLSSGELHAEGACLMDGDTGRVLFGKNENEELAMASTTKIMTCILIMENCEKDEVVTASQNAADQPKVHLGVRKGQRFLLEDLLFALMLESFNDAAVMLAEHLDGSVEAFAARMNEKAQTLGCRQTHFVTPNGLDGSDAGGEHHTTAADLGRIMRYCVAGSEKSVWFGELTRTMSHSFSDLEQTASYSCSNHNQLLSMTDGVISGKTGFTGKAGYCYVCAVENEGRTFIITLLGCGWPNNKTYKWKDTLKLLAYGGDTYTLRRPKPVGMETEIYVRQAAYAWGQSQTVPRIGIQEQVSGDASALMAENEQIRVSYSYEPELTAPVKAGTRVGSVSYYLEDICLLTNPIVTSQDVGAMSLSWCAGVLVSYFLLKNPEASIDFGGNTLYTVE